MSNRNYKSIAQQQSVAPWPVFDEEMVESVATVLRSGHANYWTGIHGRAFEKEFAEHTNCRHAVALSNGTVALELALHSLGIGPGDEVIVPSRTFIATASSVAVRGAIPVCADVDRDSQTITAATIEPLITSKTKAVIPVHLAGWPCDMDPILDLAKTCKLSVIEDCAQAHGAEYKGKPIGSMGDVSTFSFCQDKILTTGGEGGMLVTNRNELWERAWRYKDHGKTPETFFGPPSSSNIFRWVHEDFGSNYRMTEMQAAVGRIALRRLSEWVSIRRHHATKLLLTCQKHQALRTPIPATGIKHSYYKYYTFVRAGKLKHGWSRDRIIAELRDCGVPCYSGSCSEIYREKAFQSFWKPTRRHPVAKDLGETSLMFLVHPTLTEQNLNLFTTSIHTILSKASTDTGNRGLKAA